MANEDQSFLADPISYIFGGNTGLSYGDLQQRRAIAMALAKREKGFPKNKGEGMTYLGDSIAEGLQSIGLARAERARQASLKEQAKMFMPPLATASSTARPVRTAPQPAPSTTAPAAMPQIAGADPALASAGFAPGANLGSYDSSTDQPVSMITPAARAAPPPPPPPPAPVTAPAVAPEPTAAPRASLDLGPEEQLVPDDEATSVAERAPPSSPTPSLPPEATAALRTGMLRDNIAKAMMSPQFQANQPPPNAGPVTSQEGNRIAMSADTAYPGGDSAPPARVAYSGPRSSPPAQGWAATDPRWLALDDNQKAAAMAMMEANPNDDQGRIDVLAAIHNRADKEKVTVGSAVSRHTYQPTMEPSQQARLDRILADPAHAELTAVSQGYANGEPRPHTATHFLAPEKTMLALEAKNPGKYHSWRDWTGYDPQSGQYSGVQLRDNSHAFLSPDGPPPQAPSTPVRMLNVAQQANPLDPSVAAAAADQEPPQQQQAQAEPPAEPPDTQDARLAQVVGGGLPGLRARGATASLGRVGVMSDTPPIGSAGGIGANDPGIAQSVEARRNAIANTLMQNGVPAPEVPQPDPTQAGTSPSPTTASASGGSPLQLAQAGGTLTDSSMFDPRAFSGRPLDHGIAKAPPPVAAPAATAAPQAPAAPPAGQWYDRSQPKPPDPPKQMGRTDDEVKAMRWKMMNPGDPDVAAIADAIIKTEADKRTFHDTREIERYKGELSLYNTEYTKWQDEQVSRPKRVQDYVKANQGIIAGAPGVAAAAPQGDSRIGTPQSPQRSGVPTAPPVPPGTTPEQWATLHGPVLQKAQDAVEKAVPQFNDAIGLIRQARDHPGKEWGTGVTSSIARNIPGTDAYAFGKIMEQIGGKNFLQAYQQLKGGGSITEIEGTKAEAAQARLATAQSPKDFDKALADFEIALRRDLELAQRKVNQPVAAWRAPGDNASYAPDIGERRGNNEYIGGNPNDPMSWKRLR